MSARRSPSSAPVDPKDVLLMSVLRRFLTTSVADVRRLRRKNAKVLQLANKLPKHEASKEAVAKAKAAQDAKE